MDPDAFHIVFRRYSKPVLVFIYGLLGDRDRAEELTQETFIRAYQKRHTIREGGRFSSWLFGIARNVTREAIREKYRNIRRAAGIDSFSDVLQDEGKMPDERVIAEELQGRIRSALLTLPEDHRTVFVLKLIVNMRYEEIAEATGASIGKLKTDLHRARQKMRSELGPYIDGRYPGKRGVM